MPQSVLMKVSEVRSCVGIAEFLHGRIVPLPRALVKLYDWYKFWRLGYPVGRTEHDHLSADERRWQAGEETGSAF